jgi:hypothetical protein
MAAGVSRENVLGLVAVTGSGEAIRVGGNTTKHATGYDSPAYWSAAKARSRSATTWQGADGYRRRCANAGWMR